jgi:hypothetical protein
MAGTWTPQLGRLCALWPQVAIAIHSTYCAGERWAVTSDRRHNAAGYCLWMMERMEARAAEVYGAGGVRREVLDLAAAHEIRYHWRRQTAFRAPLPALAQCLYNLVSERPWALQQAQRVEERVCGGSRRGGTRGRSSVSLTATPSTSGGARQLVQGPRPLASDLREWMPPRSTR